MKKAISLILLGFTLAVFANGTIQISFRPARPEVGESVYVTVSANVSGRNRTELVLPELPGKAKWNRNMRSDSTQMSVTNNGTPQVTYKFVRQLQTIEAGKLEIPPFKIRNGNQELSSKPTVLEILPPNTRKPDKNAPPKPFGKLISSPDRPLRPGEKINFTFEFFIPENYQLLDFGVSSFENTGNAIILKNQRTGRQIEQLPPYTANVKDHEFIVHPFKISARTTSSGEYFPEAAVNLSLRELRQSSPDNFDDEFFGSFFRNTSHFGRPESVNLVLKDSSGFKVLPLPALPAGVFDPGISGKWQISAKLNSGTCRSGEIAELEITLMPQSADADSTLLKAPQLEFPGFRVYPPETLRKNGKILIRYALIPLSVGEKKVDFKLGSFDPTANKWEISEFSLPLAVTPGNVNPSTPIEKKAVTPAVAPDRTTPEVPTPPAAGVHYLKADDHNMVKIPLIKNNIRLITLLVSGGILLLVIDWLVRKFGKNFSRQTLHRRRELRQKIKAICRELKKGDDPAAVIEKHGISEIAELCGLPAGSTASDIAGEIDDPELKEFFSNIANTGFLPGAMVKKNSSGEVVDKLLKFLKKLALLIVVMFVTISLPAGIAAYNSGDFRRADVEFKRQLANDQLSPALLYNLGCTAFQLGNLPEARVWFTRALRLVPGDAESAANLKIVEEKLQLAPEKDNSTFTGQLTALRDSLFRPDQYLTLAAAGFFLLCLIVILRNNAGTFWKWGTAAAILFFIVITLLAALEQSESSYSANFLVITGKNVEIRSLPVENSGSVIKKINPGGDAILIEKRNSWYRINTGETEGWIREDQAMRVFPYGIL